MYNHGLAAITTSLPIYYSAQALRMHKKNLSKYEKMHAM